jgi:hypothetical protein
VWLLAETYLTNGIGPENMHAHDIPLQMGQHNRPAPGALPRSPGAHAASFTSSDARTHARTHASTHTRTHAHTQRTDLAHAWRAPALPRRQRGRGPLAGSPGRLPAGCWARRARGVRGARAPAFRAVECNSWTACGGVHIWVTAVT